MEEKYFSEEHFLLRDMVKDLAKNDIAPLAQRLDEEGKFPGESIKKMGELGLMGIPWSEKYGGFGMDTLSLVIAIEEPLHLTEMNDQVTVKARTFGGGKSGQADALRLGIARALNLMNVELHGALRHAGMLTRDGRIKERKKYGLAGARKRFQFSKR